jgi:hypothetical protein
MSPEASSVPMVAPWRSIMLPASFGACGVLLAILLVALIGCSAFTAAPGTIDNPPKNAVLCECTCDSGGAVAVPPKFILEGRDDAVAGNSTGNQYTLGQQTVGLRFQQLNVPNLATITAAYIQFTAAQNTSGTATLQIKIVNQPDVPPFGPPNGAPTVTFDTIPTTADQVVWAITDPWKVNDPAPGTTPAPGNPEQTPDLHVLLQAIVNDPNYTPNSAVAFIIKGLGGTRVARASESANPQPAYLTVEYVPHKATQQFLACADPADAADQAKATAVCQGRVQSNVSKLASDCHLAKSCTCTLKDQDATQFSGVCQNPCPEVTAPQNCDPTEIAKATTARDIHDPVCVANSPLGSLMTGRLSACDVDEASSGVSVTVYDEDGKNPHTAGNSARGRIHFVGTPAEQWCLPTDLGCFVGMNHRINVNNIKFDGGLFGSDHLITDLTGVGESTGLTFVDKATSQGTFAPGTTLHSGRGTEGSDTKGFFGPNATCFTGGEHFPCTPVKISAGGWQSGGACSLTGDLFDSKQLTLHSNLQGRLVNQPPTAIAGDDQPNVKCIAEAGEFDLDGSGSFDPDKNMVSFGWFKGSRTGPLVANLLKLHLQQPVSTASSNNQTSYVFKVIDLFGQYDEDTTTVNVVDTIPPHVTAPPNPCAGQKDGVCECTGPAGTPVNIGTATVVEDCDLSPVLTNDQPPLFGLGTTTVTWTATTSTAIVDALNKGTATQTVKVADRTAPTLKVTLSPTVLWPPNHKLIPITATITVSDTCDPNPTVKLISITSNEDDNGLGDGDTALDRQSILGKDIQTVYNTDTRTFLLRAERSGKGNGRIYTVTYQATDASGNVSPLQKATVVVPKSQAASQ